MGLVEPGSGINQRGWLVQEFECEICGGFKYRGRREFERHFREWRHQNSMRALGIPNNKNFFEITKIEDAKQLWANMQVHLPLSNHATSTPTQMQPPKKMGGPPSSRQPV